ncbi:MAG: alpha/beta hydrolase [Aeromicrobium sp.]
MDTNTSRRLAGPKVALVALGASALLVLGAGSSGASTISTQAANVQLASATTSTKPTIVMVHGAWSDASPFNAVNKRLGKAGYTVVNFSNPLRSLKSDTKYLASFLKTRTKGPVVLVGHSYGGALISGAALSDPDVKSLVYINGFVPKKGESIFDLSSKAGPLDPEALFDMAPLPGRHNVDLYLKKDAFAGGFSNGLSKKQTNRYFASQRPITFEAISKPAGSNPAWKTLPSWYVAGTEDHSIDISTQRFMAKRAGSTLTEVKAGHLSMVAKPKVVANVIKAAARSKR